MPLPKLPDSSLGLVANNFQNLYLAAHDTKKQEIELIPSIFGHQFYFPSVGWKGRILRFLHRCISVFLGKTFAQNKFIHALKATQECFLKLENFRRSYHDPVYKDYLEGQFDHVHCRFTENEINHAREQIQKFYQAVYPLSKLIRNQKNQKLNEFLSLHFKELYAENKKPFYCEESYKDIKGYVRIIAIEGMARGELPLRIFREKSLDFHEEEFPVQRGEEAFGSFINKMSKAKKQGMFQIQIFHSAIKSIIRHLKHHQTGNFYNLKKLEQELIKEECVFLNEFDRKHIEWRDQIKKEDSFVNENEPFYFLDENYEKFFFEIAGMIQPHEKPEDRYKVFEIRPVGSKEKYQNFLMIVGPNKVCLEYSDLIRQESSWGLETPEIKFIHPKGKYAIVEKLPYSMGSIDWNSDLLGELQDEDKPYADALQALFQFFVDEKNSPKDLKVEHLRFDSAGRLKSIKDCVPRGHIDYIALEEVAYELAQKNNLPVYQHLVKPLLESKFCKNKLTPFFKTSLLSAFEGTDSIEALSKMHGVKDPLLIKRGENLQNFAKQIKEEGYAVISEHYPSVNRETILLQLSKCLLNLYERDKTLGRFWGHIGLEEVIEEVEKDMLFN